MAVKKDYRYALIDCDKTKKVYREEYDRIWDMSKILNDQFPNLQMMLWNRQSVESQLIMLQGDSKGNYYRGDDPIQAYLPSLKNELEKLQSQFAEINLNRKSLGLVRYTVYPQSLETEKQKIEARQDVCQKEIDVLQEFLRNYKETEAEVQAGEVLRYGLRQNCQLCLDPDTGLTRIRTIDGQRVTYIDDEPIISDQRSKYFGYSVASYRSLAKSWLFERKKRELEKFAELCKELQSKGQPSPTSPRAVSVKVVNPAGLPDMPASEKNWLISEEKEVTESKSKLKRN